MRHQNFGKKLNRDVKERKALFKSLVSSLVIYGKIKTSIAKARAVRGLVEKLVTSAKTNSNAAIRQVASVLGRKELIDKMVKEIAPRFQNRLGGYLRMVKLGRRKSDATEEVVLEWTEGAKEKVKTEEKTKKAAVKTGLKETRKELTIKKQKKI